MSSCHSPLIRPRTDKRIDRHTVDQRIQKPHGGRLIFDLFPVARKDKNGRDQCHNEAGDDDGKIPGRLILENRINP